MIKYLNRNSVCRKMPNNKPVLVRQSSNLRALPLPKHNCNTEYRQKTLPNKECSTGPLLGNDLNQKWFKSFETEKSGPSENEFNLSKAVGTEEAVVKTLNLKQYQRPNTHKDNKLLIVRPHGIISKSGDLRFRKVKTVEDIDKGRPTTVSTIREKESFKEAGEITCKLRINNLTKTTSENLNDTETKNELTIAKFNEPLPPLKPSSLVSKESKDCTKLQSKENYYQKSEEILDNMKDFEAVSDQTTEKNEKLLRQRNETENVDNQDNTNIDEPEKIEESSMERLHGYRSVTPLSLCDVISDVGNRSVDSEAPPVFVSISDSDDYDTDLEIDENFGKDVAPDEDMNIRQWVYRKECKRLQIPPEKHIVKGLAKRVLSLRNRSLGPKAIPPLCQALKDNLRVEILNLDGTDVTDGGVKHIAEMMLENITITHLNLANNNLALRAAQMISHVMIATDNLTYLNLSGNKFDNHASWYLSHGVGSNTSITHLDLSYNDFGEHGGVMLGTGLARNTKILVLNLTWNKVCGKGAVAILQALMVNTVLQVLDISWNGLGYEGAVALSKCLKVNKSLVDIDVSNNRLDWRCGFLLAEGLTANCMVQKLKIGYNPLTTAGCMDILEAVAAEESTLNLLDCSGITVVGEADLLAATISRRRKFQFIHGGIVTTHDKVGKKQDREVNPMLRIIEYLRLLGLRPLELMKSFDKSSSFELPRKEFIEQIKKIGVKLQPYEIEALANSVSGKGYNKNVINYRKLSLAVREVVQAERERKLREREEWVQIKSYHENILRKGQLDVSHNSSRIADRDSLKAGGIQVTSGVFGTSIDSVSSMARVSPVRSKVQLSMCSPLESSRSIIYSPQKRKKKLKKRKDVRKSQA